MKDIRNLRNKSYGEDVYSLRSQRSGFSSRRNMSQPRVELPEELNKHAASEEGEPKTIMQQILSKIVEMSPD